MSRPDLSGYYEDTPFYDKKPSLKYPFAAGALVFLGRLLAYPRMKNIHAREGYFQRTRLYVQGTVVYGIILSMLQPEVWRSLQKRNDQNREAREEYIRRRQEAREKEELTSKAPVS